MTLHEPPDDEMFINANFLENGPIRTGGVTTNMINPVSSASALSQALATQNTAPPKPQPSSEPKDSVQLSQKAQTIGDVDHDGDSH